LLLAELTEHRNTPNSDDEWPFLYRFTVICPPPVPLHDSKAGAVSCG
jgi:hypothetical protein